MFPSLRSLNSQVEEPVRLKKHKVIAQAFAKRKTFNKAGRLSLSFHSTHEDPVGKLFYHFSYRIILI
jgi:smoothened protein